VDVGSIDYWANKGDSALHKASAPSKVLATALIIAGVLVTGSLFVLLAIYLAVAVAIVSARLPARRIATIAAYPAIFALIFAVSRWDGNIVNTAVIVVKALDAALTPSTIVVT
jgi:energy-coupling factor transporter transmembrane protein EcfT